MSRARAVRQAAVAVGLGLLAATGQAPLGFWPVSLVALGLLASRTARESGWRRAVLTGWTAGVGYFGGALFWIVEPFMVDAARDGWMAPFALVLMATGLALFWGLAGAGAGLGRGLAGRAAGFGVALVASDLLRGYVLTGFPWALVGHVWIATPVAQAAAYVGPVGLSALTMVIVILPVAGSARGVALAGLALSAAILAGLWGLGLWRLADGPSARPDGPVVRLVQPNATQSLKWQPGMWDTFIGRQLDATAAAAVRPLDLVVWPETAVPYLLADAGDLLAAADAASGGVPVALGIQRSQGSRYYNSLAVTDGKGGVAATYDKVHLVPFGEYVPLGDLAARFGISAFAAQSGFGYSAGAAGALVDTGRAGRILPLICYEAVFPQDLRAFPGRADWILQVTNDGWFGSLAGPWQHLAQARLRAIEQGLPLLRAANTGITAAFDGKGRLLTSLALNTEGWVDVQVPAALPETLYARTGDWPLFLSLVATILVMAAARRRLAN